MFKGALFLALGFVAVCFPVAAQQTKHSGVAQHRAATAGTTTFEHGSTLSLYPSNVVDASNASLLFHNGPVRLGRTVRNWRAKPRWLKSGWRLSACSPLRIWLRAM